jgi:2-polyprenyl-3-methyl-5-hydroxy-6-metoxy-1,4-benzoquinol methylase
MQLIKAIVMVATIVADFEGGTVMKSQVHSKVQKYYGGIAKSITQGQHQSCCGCGSNGKQSCCDGISSSAVIYNGENLNDLPKEAVDASLGCANPLVFAQLKQGETVLDLGSGGGINVFMAAKQVGKTGKVYGLDMTDEMLTLARCNQEKMGVENVEFIKGFIEDIRPVGITSMQVSSKMQRIIEATHRPKCDQYILFTQKKPEHTGPGLFVATRRSSF